MDTKINVQVAGYEGVTLMGQARGHVVMIDRVAQKGGNDKGPMGGELLLLGLGGCYMSTLLAALREQASNIPTDLIKVNVSGTLASAPVRFSEITVSVSAPKEMQESLSKQFLMAERGCLVHNTLRQGTDVRFDYEWYEQESQHYSREERLLAGDIN